MTRKPRSHVRILVYQAWAITQDSSRERALIFLWKVMPNKKKTTAEDLTKLLDDNLGEIAAGGNLNLKLSFVSSFAQALNEEQDTEKQSDEDIKAKKEVITFVWCSVITNIYIVCLVFQSVVVSHGLVYWFLHFKVNPSFPVGYIQLANFWFHGHWLV